MTAVRDVAPPGDAEGPADLDFAEFARREEPRLRRFVCRRLGNWHEAEEITQETLLRAYLKRDSFADERAAAAWCSTVARNLVIDRVRVAPRSTTLAEIPERARLQRDVADVAAARADARLALSVLGDLPDRQAAVLWAREVEGLSYDAIGERMALTEPAVRSVLFRARRALREAYLRRGGTLPVAALAVLAFVRRLVRRPSGRQVSLASATAVVFVGAALVLPPYGADGPADRAPYSEPASSAPVAQRAGSAAGTAHVAPAPPGATTGEARARPRAQVCARTLRHCVSYGPGLPGTRLVVRLPFHAPATHSDSIGVSTKLVGQCSAVPATPVLSCQPASPANRR